MTTAATQGDREGLSAVPLGIIRFGEISVSADLSFQAEQGRAELHSEQWKNISQEFSPKWA